MNEISSHLSRIRDSQYFNESQGSGLADLLKKDKGLQDFMKKDKKDLHIQRKSFSYQQMIQSKNE